MEVSLILYEKIAKSICWFVQNGRKVFGHLPRLNFNWAQPAVQKIFFVFVAQPLVYFDALFATSGRISSVLYFELHQRISCLYDRLRTVFTTCGDGPQHLFKTVWFLDCESWRTSWYLSIGKSDPSPSVLNNLFRAFLVVSLPFG